MSFYLLSVGIGIEDPRSTLSSPLGTLAWSRDHTWSPSEYLHCLSPLSTHSCDSSGPENQANIVKEAHVIARRPTKWAICPFAQFE
jgi:hypothetical protein